MPMDEERLADEVSRLYWETDVSVGEIASQLDVSRRALYAALRPLPAGDRCTECGGELVFMTRSARTQGAAECAACGHEQDVAVIGAAAAADDDEDVAEEGAAVAATEATEPTNLEYVEDYGAAVAAALRTPRGMLIAAAAVVGLAAGMVGAIRMLRR